MTSRLNVLGRWAPLAATLALSGCMDSLDLDFRPGPAGTSDAALSAAAAPPRPDANGVVRYPSYEVAIARRGDSVASIAERLGLSPEELGRLNGIDPAVPLRPGEVVALPKGAASPAAPAAAGGGTIDIATLAGAAIDRSESTGPGAGVASGGIEPVRHKVERGETVYSIARLYSVSVRALADWNGLGPDLEVREGQYLLIPTALSEPEPAPGPEPARATPAAAPAAAAGAAAVATAAPGAGSAAPTPPSAAAPLPRDEPAATAPAPEPAAAPAPAPAPTAPASTAGSGFAMPADGAIIRAYEKGKNDGIGIAASAGSPVRAAADGTVAAITRDTGQMAIVVVRHADDLLSVYANVDDITVAKGDAVRRGERIAAVRNGEPAFLHFELRDGFESVDPMPYFN